MKAIRTSVAVAVALCMMSNVALAQDRAEAPATRSELHPDVVRLIDTWLESEQAFKKLPTLVVNVVKGDKTVFAKGYGNVDVKRTIPATPDTVYSICSISKLFTSIAIMQLVEQGKVRLDDELVSYLPDFRLEQPEESSGPVTIRGILMHAAGLPRDGIDDYWTGPDYRFPTREALLSGLAAQAMYDRALNRHQYSNLGIALLGEVVARASGEPYERYVNGHVLTPLDLKNTAPRMTDALRGTEMAVGFGGLKRDGTRDVVPAFDVRGLQAAAGFSSTVNDLSKFAIWQFRVLRSGKTEVLRAATLREMQRIHWTDPDGKTTWGLGFAVSRSGSDQYVGHAGQCPGYRTIIWLMPHKELGAVVALSSAEPPSPYARRVLELAQKVPTKAPEKPLTPLPVPSDYAGRYARTPWTGDNLVMPWGSDLAMLSLPTDNPAEAFTVLRPVGGDRFKFVREDKTLGAEVKFIRDANGKVGAMRAWSSTSVRQP